MPDFSSMLRNPAGQAKKPETLPTDDYPGVVTSFEYGDNNKNKTPYLRVHFRLLGAGQADGNADALAALGIDPSKRQLRRDYYLRGKDANDKEAQNSCLFRIDEMLRACGVEPNGQAYDELIPTIIGANVLLQVKQRLNENSDSGDMFNEIGKVAKLA